MAIVPTETLRGLRRSWGMAALPILGWNLVVAAATALAACLVLLGRALPSQATIAWALVFLLFFCAIATWLTIFSSRLLSPLDAEPVRTLRVQVLIEGPLLVLSSIGSAAIYLSDSVNHQLTYFLQPTPVVVLLLTILATVAAQRAVAGVHCERRLEDVDHVKTAGGRLGALRNEAAPRNAPRHALVGGAERFLLALSLSRPWAIPLSLLLLGLLQDFSYLWVIGNDFTRYWAIADALGSAAGYPASINQPSYVEGGMYRYSIELPVFPVLLLWSFRLLGHDTLGAHLPALLANTTLPLLLYAFYRKARFEPPLAFAATAVVVLFPFFRLYTLNAPVPDAVFVALLVATGYVFLHLTENHSALITRHLSLVPWLAFGLLAGLSALTRPEGAIFAAAMFVGLAPNLFRPRFYLAAVAFLLMVIPFSLLMMSTFGIPWPRNAGSSFSLENIGENLDWLGWLSLPWYAGPFGLSPSAFALVVELLAAATLLGTLWLGRRRWQLALLVVAAGLHVATVLTIAPRVAGADLWYDFFRHISYGLPFAALPLFFMAERIAGYAGMAFRRITVVPTGFPWSAAHIVAWVALAFSVYWLSLLARPSQTYGTDAGQLLTSDVWVTAPDLIANRYLLPTLPFVKEEGILMIDPSFEYIPRHLEGVKSFFEPVSAINVGTGFQYEISSLLVLLFGAVFAFWGGLRSRFSRWEIGPGEASRAEVPLPEGQATSGLP